MFQDEELLFSQTQQRDNDPEVDLFATSAKSSVSLNYFYTDHFFDLMKIYCYISPEIYAFVPKLLFEKVKLDCKKLWCFVVVDTRT